MNTPTHLLVGAGAFAAPGSRSRNAAALTGAILPDLAIYLLWAWARLAGHGEHAIWSELYFSPTWQTLTTIGNSAPLYAAVAAAGRLAGRPALAILGLSALAHIALDLPLHAGDAHAHFWPFSDWRFESPVSYWNPRHHGEIFRFVEIALALVLVTLLWRRFAGYGVRALLIVSLLPYVAVPAYFTWAMTPN